MPLRVVATPEPRQSPVVQNAHVAPSEHPAMLAKPGLQAEYDTAEAELNQAWEALSPETQNRYRKHERDWIKLKDALPLERRISAVEARTKLLRSLPANTDQNLAPTSAQSPMGPIPNNWTREQLIKLYGFRGVACRVHERHN
jgi:Lysozyme inhibitor LprI